MCSPAISRSSIVTADRELKHAATVPRLAAKILQKRFLVNETIPIGSCPSDAHPATKIPTKNLMCPNVSMTKNGISWSIPSMRPDASGSQFW
jgi:hypothetical protein